MIIRLLCLLFGLAAAAASAEPLRAIKVTSDRAPDCSSLEAIVASVTRNCKTDDQRAIALYNFCRYACYQHECPTEPSGVSALKLVNVYGWGPRAAQHTLMAALWEKAGYGWRYRVWNVPGRATVEASYRGRWHYLDATLPFYAWMSDPQAPGGQTIAGQEDIRANPGLLTEAFQFDVGRKVFYRKDSLSDDVAEKSRWLAPAFLLCGDDLAGVMQAIKTAGDAGSPRGWGGFQFDDPAYSTDVNLGPGWSLTLLWDKINETSFYSAGSNQPPRQASGDKEYRNCPDIGPLLEPYRAKGPARSWSSGRLVFHPDLKSEASLAGFAQVENVVWKAKQLHPKEPSRPGVLTVEIASPYVVVRNMAKLTGEAATAEMSPDGRSWQPLELNKPSQAMAGRYRYYIRITLRKPISDVYLSSAVQHNQQSLPYLAPGRNQITITAANPPALGANRLVVTCAYCPGFRSVSPQELFERGAEIAQANAAAWFDRPVVVRKVVDRWPCTLEIPIATPKGRHPVYPRMVFLRREVLVPGQEPMPVPAPPTNPQVGRDEMLAELPNPWMIGAEPAPLKPARPMRVTVLPPAKIAYVSNRGGTFEHRDIKWPKDNSEATALLVAFEPEKIAALRPVASAKLVLYVDEAHDKSPMQVGVVALQSPFELRRPFDFGQLGPTLGTAIVARGGGASVHFQPPRRYEIDVTQEARAWTKGKKPCSLAVRIVPNRSVDDGWMVRFTPAKEKPAELTVATYTDQPASK